MKNNEPPISLPQICAPREELLRVFDRYAGKQYIYISAPAGYGKTVSAQLWLKKGQRPFSWLFLDKYDNVLSLFYRSLCRSLLEIAQPLKNDTMTDFINSPSFSAAPIENTIEVLSVLLWREGPCVLILDDLHNLSNIEILKSLPYILKRLPASVNVLLLSRTKMPDEMRMMEEAGKVGFIGKEEMIFSVEEIRNHFIDYGRLISEERAKEIFLYTEGWIIILNVMVLMGDQGIFHEDYKLSLQDYFKRRAWDGFDETIKSFLMKTSIVDSFTPELCDLLTETSNSTETLEMLISNNINLTHFGTEYRYHNLFLEFLRDQVQKNGIDRPRLFSAAARYYMDCGQFFQAGACSMHSDDPQLKMQVVQTFFNSKNPSMEQFLELSGVYAAKEIPAAAFERSPILYMPNILAAFLQGEPERAADLFDRFYVLLRKLYETNHPILGSIPGRLLMDHRIKLSEMISFMEKKDIKWDEPFPGQAAVVTVQMPMLHRSVREFYEFLSDETMEGCRRFFAHVLPGDQESFYLGVRAGLFTEKNMINEALEAAQSAYNGMTENTAVEIYFGICVGLAEALNIKGETERGSEILRSLRLWLDDKRALYLLKNLMAYNERLKILDGNKTVAKNWLENYFVDENVFSEFYKVYQNFTTVRALIVLAETEKAREALAEIRALSTAMDRPLDTAEADVLIAIIEWVSGKKKESANRLLDVLARMQSYGFIRVFANEGKAIMPIIASVLKKLDKEIDKKGELYRFTKEVQLASYEQSRKYKSITHDLMLRPIKLSPKQTMVLELLSKGHKNAEIIELTGLSINTIREHTRVAYRKLDVTNAADAALKAKRLGLIE